MAERIRFTVFFPTPLIFRYHLPLRYLLRQAYRKYRDKKHVVYGYY
jgi:hypothetical protein